MEISLYHNVIITGSNDHRIYVYDFEIVKLIGVFKLN